MATEKYRTRPRHVRQLLVHAAINRVGAAARWPSTDVRFTPQKRTSLSANTRPTANPLSVATHAKIADRPYRRSLHPASMVADRAGCGFGGRFRCLRRNAFCHPNRHQNAYLGRSALAPAGGAIPRVLPATADPRSN